MWRRGDEKGRPEVLDPARHLVPGAGRQLPRNSCAQRHAAVLRREGVACRPQTRRSRAGLVEEGQLIALRRSQRVRAEAAAYAVDQLRRSDDDVVDLLARQSDAIADTPVLPRDDCDRGFGAFIRPFARAALTDEERALGHGEPASPGAQFEVTEDAALIVQLEKLAPGGVAHDP